MTLGKNNIIELGKLCPGLAVQPGQCLVQTGIHCALHIIRR